MPKAKTPTKKRPPKKQTPRITAAEKDARVNKVFELLVNGFTRYQILQYASSSKPPKKDWNVTTRQIDSYISEATAMIAAEAEYLRPKEIGKALTRMNDIYQKSMKVQDYQRAIAAQREINALLSLYEPPATQTLRILGIEEKQLAQLVELLSKVNQKPSDLFAALIQELATEHGN